MNKIVKAGAVMVLMTTLCAELSFAADALNKDLTAVIALQGQPCGQVVSAVKKGDNDHIATCKDGNRYRVFLNAEGRVIVQKQ
jgi:hypothetical protein